MARVRVIVYRDMSDEVLSDFLVEDPDKNSYRVADLVEGCIPDENYVRATTDDERTEAG